MAYPMSARVATAGSSLSLEEAKKSALHFFRQVCRSLPRIMDIYNLHDVTTTSQLRSAVAAQFRKHADVSNPKVIDMLIFKGEEDLRNYIDHSKQRHHILGQFVIGQEGLIPSNIGFIDRGDSEFLRKFYDSNNF